MGYGQICVFGFGKDMRAMNQPALSRHLSLILCSVKPSLELSFIYQIYPRQSQQSQIQAQQRLFQTSLISTAFQTFPGFSAAGSFYIWPDLCSMVRTISATIVFSGKTICQKLHLLRKNTCQKCRKLVYVI